MTIDVAKIKALISCAVNMQLTSAFVSAYARIDFLMTRLTLPQHKSNQLSNLFGFMGIEDANQITGLISRLHYEQQCSE